ncbi:MAG TPA: SOS response-associated peptidase family protein [Rhizomicrobium sp.]|jgi:putative SOS response-associated peptidase YedK|nr:SOS response-associated peptidase family protein [Rhizomicrobium sp.]
MCGKFAAKSSWREVTNVLDAMNGAPRAEDEDRDVGYRVMSALPVIVWDVAQQRRRIVAMRWGFPARTDPRRPDPIHVRAETIDERPTFRDAFLAGQRGIVLAKNFNEAPDSGEQHTITPGDDSVIGIAFLWRRFGDLIACVMATVPANDLIAGLPTDRMPAILAPEDWAIWLGEEEADLTQVKACLKTAAGADWRMSREQRAAKSRRKPTMMDPGGLF